MILSRLANLYSDRFYGFAWLALSYLPPAWQTTKVGGEWDETGSEGFGYWEFLTSNDAAELCEKNVSTSVLCKRHDNIGLRWNFGADQLDCFLQMAYPVTPQLVHGWNLPPGKTREWIESNVTHGLPAWLPKEVGRVFTGAQGRDADIPRSIGVRYRQEHMGQGGAQVVHELLQSGYDWRERAG